MKRRSLLATTAILGLAGATWTVPARAAEGDVLIEFHYLPVPDAQIAVWLEDAEGNFVQDVFVTQATGTLGIGNRPGRWDFLSSWRFPYGPRPNVLPVWAHARGKTYPKIIFHDDDPSDQESLGWHENSSSPEPYFCRPLNATEHETISTDTMTCPSPSTFQSDKGRFHDTETAVYPPRGDLVQFEAEHDHDDVRRFSEFNDLDAYTGATPRGDSPEIVTAIVPEDRAGGPLVAHIEINVEDDQNPHWSFDREDDHFVDPRLASFGIPWLGQPSVVYRVEIDPTREGFAGAQEYAGVGQWDGTSGMLHPPDDTISLEGGSGADRLQLHEKNGETFRFGVYSHGPGSGTGGGDPDAPGWGGCRVAELPAMGTVEVEPVEFDTVRVHFTVPSLPEDAEIKNVLLYYRTGTMPLSDANASSAIQQVPGPADCAGPLVPGEPNWCEIRELFGNYDYQVGVRYEDQCSNRSAMVASAVTTPQQEFEAVEGFCFVATAAWGANWADEVQTLRWFRDDVLRNYQLGVAFVQVYYTFGPVLAKVIADRPVMRGAARVMLKPLADFARYAVAVHR